MVGQILVDHALSYALTATADVPAIYIQQLWRTVKQVPNANETILFMVDKKDIIYTMDMFCATLKMPIETPKQPFIPPDDFDYIKSFLKILGYQGSLECLTSRMTFHVQSKINVMQIFHAVVNKVHVDYASLSRSDFLHYVMQKKSFIQYPHFTKLIITDLIEKYESISKRLEDEYHTNKDDTPLLNMYITRKVTVRGIHIPNNLPTDEIKDTHAYKDYVECITPNFG
ncbi:hypothetical protein Tco_0040024 [Tanacetum coccineum]